MGTRRKSVSLPPRVVLDTNIIVSALLFSQGRLSSFRDLWQHGHILPLISRDSVQELLRVLIYPKFKLSSEEREDLFADYLPFAEVVAIPTPAPSMPSCRDPKDELFLHLALTGQAQALLTGDADLLALAQVFPIPIQTPERWLARHHLS